MTAMIITTVFVDGPFPNANRYSDWDEYPEWVVGTMDADGNESRKIYRYRTYDAAVELGQKMAHDRELELLDEASPYF